MTPNIAGNGLFVRDVNVEVSSHVDSYHMFNMMKDAKPTDLGVVELWAQTQKVQMPLYQFADFKGKNTIMVEDPQGRYTWKSTIANDLPYIVEDIEVGNDNLGIDGTSFKLKLNQRAFGKTSIICFDKMNGLEMIVTDDDILPTGDGYIYTVKLVNRDNAAVLSHDFIKAGNTIFRKGSAKGPDYGERYDDMTVNMGYREYYNFVGGMKANVKYSISNRAKLIAEHGMNKDGTLPGYEIWRWNDPGMDPSITTLDELVKKKGNDYIKSAYSNGNLTRSFITSLEARHIAKVGYDLENYCMWGQGGSVSNDGPDNGRLSVGLWKQLDNGYKKIYNKTGFSLDMFESEIFNFFDGKIDFQGPDSKRKLIVQTGLGGFKMLNDAIKRSTFASGLQIQGATNGGIGAISGSAMNLNYGFAYTGYNIPFLANMQFVINPSFDNVHTNAIENPKVDGYNLSSYNFIIFDVTDNQNDNIFLLKYAPDHLFRWFYVNGDMDYKGQNGHSGAGFFSGFEVAMSQTMPAIHVKDPTRILKFVMTNPQTGGSL